MAETATAPTAAPAAPQAPAQEGAEGQNTGKQLTPGKETAASAKPTDPLEASVAEKYGDEWAALPESMKKRVLEGEKKVRDADKKYQQLARIQKEHEYSTRQMAALVNALKTDPLSVLQNPALGHDVRKIAESYVWDRIQEEKLDPKEREHRKLQTDYDQLKKQQEMEKKSREKEELDRHISQRRGELENLIIKTCETNQLPNKPEVVSRMAYYIGLARRNGHALTPEIMGQIATRTRQDFRDWAKTFFESDPDEKLLEDLDGPLIERLRKADLKRLKAKGLSVGSAPSNEQRPSAPSKKQDMSDWLDQRDQRMKLR